MRSEEADWPIGSHWLDAAWAVFALFNLAVMVALPEWETVPFHFIWVSLTLLYGFRVWDLRRTSLVLAFVILTTGASIIADAISGTEPVGEIAEVPLMSAMFLAMVWHARRRAAALEEVQRVSQANARLLDREKQFLQDASHELRTPITVALGHTELIMRAALDPTITEDARVVADELWRMRGLADRLLLLAASERPAFLTLSRVSPESIVEAALRRWNAIPRDWRRSVRAVPSVMADIDQLPAALDALIENAVQHTQEHEVIELGLRAEDGHVVIAVADTGTGIAAEHLEHIFGRFARAESGRDRREGVGGVGLGLSIAKAIAQAHGGDLRVQSTEGAGSRFELIIPATTAATQPPASDPLAGVIASG
jgi:signal transduction histidine kinase